MDCERGDQLASKAVLPPDFSAYDQKNVVTLLFWAVRRSAHHWRPGGRRVRVTTGPVPVNLSAKRPCCGKKQSTAFQKGQGMPLRYVDSAPDVMCWLSDYTVLPCSAPRAGSQLHSHVCGSSITLWSIYFSRLVYSDRWEQCLLSLGTEQIITCLPGNVALHPNKGADNEYEEGFKGRSWPLLIYLV